MKSKLISTPLWSNLRREWLITLIGSIGAFFLGIYLIGGNSFHLLANLDKPLSYGGDILYFDWIAKRIMQTGWYFHNFHSGYPFGSNLLDFPATSIGYACVIKIISFFTADAIKATNLYFLLSFSLIFIFSYGVIRSFALSKIISIMAALLFVMLPFHFQRFGHLEYTLYFTIPLFFYYGFMIYDSIVFSENISLIRWIGMILTGLLVSQFMTYYAFFGIILIFSCIIIGIVEANCCKLKFLKFGLMFCLVISIGVGLSLVPRYLNNMKFGKNEVLINSRYQGLQAEIYGLKLIQLVLPIRNHRIASLAEFRREYDRRAPLANENGTASLGLLGSIGFLISLFFLLVGYQFRNNRLALLSKLNVILFIFFTIGGFSSLFAIIVSPLIRAYNRGSVFIAFSSLVVFAMLLNKFLDSEKFSKYINLKYLIVIFITILGVLDQTSPSNPKGVKAQYNNFNRDKCFIENIENSFNSSQRLAIYQMPYMSIIGVLPLYGIKDEEYFKPALLSRRALWNYGGMRARAGDYFYSVLNRQNLTVQISVIKKLGFSGIYFDKRGYKNGTRAQNKLEAVLNKKPELIHPSGNIFFYKLDNKNPVFTSQVEPFEIAKKVGFYADADGIGHTSVVNQRFDFGDLKKGVNFSEENNLPLIIQSISGFSGAEPFGRWSDASISKFVKIKFFKELPKKFELRLEAFAFTNNSAKPFKLTVGNFKTEFSLNNTLGNITIDVVNAGGVNFIEILPLNPVSPKSLDVHNKDSRQLGFALSKMWIISQ